VPVIQAPTIPAATNERIDAANTAEPKRWQVGTLVYSTGGLVVLFCWLLWGDFAWSMKDRSIQGVVQLLLRKFNASDLVTGLLLVSIPPAMTILLVPIFSYMSDRHRGRWGRRIPYLLIPTPIAALAIAGFAFSPMLGSRLHAMLGPRSPGLDVLTLTVLGVFWTIFESATVIAQAIFTALVNDVVPRAVLGRFFGMFRALSLIAGIVFNYWMFGKADEHFVAIFLGIGALYAVGFTVMCLKVKEGRYPPPPPLPSSGARESSSRSIGAAREYLRDCFTKPYYLWVFAAIVLPRLAFLPINTFNYYFARQVQMTGDTYGRLMALYYLLSLVQTIPLGWLADKIHPLRVAVIAVSLHAIASLWGALFIRDAHSFGVAYVLTGTLSGTWFTATAALPAMLLPKLKFAQYTSALEMLFSAALLFSGPIMGRLLDYTNHQYRYTYMAGFILEAAALCATVVVFRKFKKLGGARHYVPPE
jgi:maltose/moltooligosaccharide transporter